jgi:hypothetical protein
VVVAAQGQQLTTYNTYTTAQQNFLEFIQRIFLILELDTILLLPAEGW